MAAGRTSDRKAEDERNDKSQSNSDDGKPPKAADLHPVRSKITYRSSDAPGVRFICHGWNLSRWVRFEPLEPLCLAYEGDDPIHVLLR